MTAQEDKYFRLAMKSVRQINQCFKATIEQVRIYLRFNWRSSVVHMSDCELLEFIQMAMDKAVCNGYLETECGKYWVSGTCPPECPPPCPPPKTPPPPCPPQCIPPCVPACPKPCPPPMCPPPSKPPCPPPPKPNTCCPAKPCPKPCPKPPACPPPCPPPKPKCPPPCKPPKKSKCPPPCPPPKPKCALPCPPTPQPECSVPCSSPTSKSQELKLKQYFSKSASILNKKVASLERHRVAKQLRVLLSKAKNLEQQEKIRKLRSNHVWN